MFLICQYTSFLSQVAEIFLDFQRSVYKSVKEDGWDGTDSNDDGDQQWSFAGSLLFAVTVITTIGKREVSSHCLCDLCKLLSGVKQD